MVYERQITAFSVVSPVCTVRSFISTLYDEKAKGDLKMQTIDEARIDEFIAEHSMCQPGRPAPHGDSHVGSPGLDIFQSTKSRGLRFALSTSTRAPA